MRKSERIRQLEFAVLKLEMHVDLMEQHLISLLETLSMDERELDAGKWYSRKNDKSE